MLEKRTPIPVGEAVKKVMQFAKRGQVEYVPVASSFGRYVSEDVVADQDVPAFDRSPYDGFAIRSVDSMEASRENPVRFEVVGTIGAGFVFSETLQPFQAVRIMTGAPIPDGCDAVVMLELTQGSEENQHTYMTIKRAFTSGTNISYQGEDVQKGTVLVRKGAYINPGVTALLATFGYADVPVFKKPVIGVIATGSELLEPHEALVPGKIRNSNAFMMLAQIERAGATAKYFGQLSDDLDLCIEAVKHAMTEVDCLITTGGVSVGDFDYLPQIYEAIGANVLFNKVAQRPGSVTTVAECDGQLLFGLSGNPSACYVGFELYTHPVIRTFFGNERPHLRKEKATLATDFKKANPFTRFVRSTVRFEGNQLVAAPSGFDKSSAVSSLATANAFIVLPGGTRGYEEGMDVDVLLLEDHEGSEWPWDNIVASYK